MTSQDIAIVIDCAIPIGIGAYIIIARRRMVSRIVDPLKRAKTDKTLRIVGPLAISAGCLTALAQILSYESPAAKAAKVLNDSPNKMIDSYTRFDGATAGPGEKVVIEETLISITADQIPLEKWEEIRPKLREKIGTSSAPKFTGKGITVVYHFRDKNGLLIGEIVFTPTGTTKA